MGIFSKIKGGVSSKANAALDKAISPEKELEMAIVELEDGRKKALAELVSYKATAKLMDADMEKQRAKAVEWEKRAMLALKAGDENAAREALKQKKHCESEATKIERDKHEAASYAIQLNKSRKEFETKLTMLKLRKGTLATQIAAARSSGGDAFGNDSSVWDKFKRAEDRIDAEAIETEVDAAMRGEEAEAQLFDAKLAAASASAGALPAGDGNDPLDALKSKMADAKAAKQKQLGAAPAAAAADAKPTAVKPEAPKADAPKADAKPEPKPEAKPDAPKGEAPKAAAPKDAPRADAAKPDAAPAADAEPPRPPVKIDQSKLESELAALRAMLDKGELDDK